MFLSKQSTPAPPISHDILTEKQNEVSRLARQANEAVDLVTRTINDLEGINQQIDSALSEIDAYAQNLAATRAAMSKQRSSNTAIIANFSKLLGVEVETASKRE